MIRTFCAENESDWNEGINLLLFAVRESVQESLGFSPFELVFGHRVRGPLALLKEQWINKELHTNLLDYVLKFKDRLHKACSLAEENLKLAQEKMKTWYDKDARMRMFKPGDKVLVLFPVQTNPLQTRFHGPYEIVSKINDVDYVVKTPDRRRSTQLCHINMLKPYFEKQSDAVTVVVSENEFDLTRNMIDDSSDFHSKSNIVSVRLPNSTILENIDEKLAHLQLEQRQQMKELIFKYGELFPDVPRRTTIASHDVDVGDAKPIKQHPYRMNMEKCELAEKEIEYMLENNIIRHSNSNWSSPCVMVPKPDGSIRFCTDYRKVNAVTKTDAYPIPRVDDCVDKLERQSSLQRLIY
ncbi:uncharacterized protein LOC132380544 [Hypanus sabinus]|uniref:uncharacterized protein LOC132380544 n=1 Tax=Hypanus sabinus TaxID=79690 RepID=UPI0028C38746|nr:uncharacterized protein LOC132380544 [Hypanus sabinus]